MRPLTIAKLRLPLVLAIIAMVGTGARAQVQSAGNRDAVAPVVPQDGEAEVIDLAAALHLAGASNPTIQRARMAVRESSALLRGAQLVWLPNISAGASYRNHVGVVQSSFGQIRNGPLESAYVGSGARPIGADTVAFPGVRLMTQLTDAIYEPLAARQRTSARRWDARAVDNDILLQTAVAYFNLVGAENRLAALRQSYVDVRHIVDTTEAYAIAGQGRRGDANRALAESLLLLVEVRRAEERMVVAAAELSRLLHLEPSTRLHALECDLHPFDLVDLRTPLAEMLMIAGRNRPELVARGLDVAERQTRVRQERTRPFLPLISVGYSAGGFGGTGNFTPDIPPFTAVTPRTDFDAFAVWTVQNLGLGNVATINARRAAERTASGERLRAFNQVRVETAEAFGLATARRGQVAVAEQQIRLAEEAFSQDYNRLRQGEALPLEVLNSVRLLTTARQELIDAVTGDNIAQFRLFVAMGQPPRLAADGLLSVETVEAPVAEGP